MEQNRSYRSEAANDESDTSTSSSSSKKSATPRYQGAAYQPVAQPRSYDASHGAESSLPRAPLEAWIPLRHRIVQEQIDRKESEERGESSDDDSATTTTQKPTSPIPQPRVHQEHSGFVEQEQRRAHDMAEEQHKQEASGEDDEEDDKDTAQSLDDPKRPVAKPKPTDGQQPQQPEHVPFVPAEYADQSVVPTAEHEQPLPPLQSHQAENFSFPPETAHQEQAFTPPQEGIPTLSIPENMPPPAPMQTAEDAPLHQQWQSEAAPALTTMAAYVPQESAPQADYNQPPVPPIKPPVESSAFAQPPEDSPYNPNLYPSYEERPLAQPTEYQPSAAQTREYVAAPEQHNNWRMPTLLMLGAVLYEGHRRRIGDRREAAQRSAADEALEKRFSGLASRRHEDVLRAQAATTENIRELQTEQHHYIHEQQRLRDIQERFGSQPLTYGSERAQSASVFGAEQPMPARQAEQHPAAGEQVPGGKPAAELTAEEAIQQAQEQQERTREVQSIWHKTEVNAVTGQEVEGVVHGKGYHEERQQEIMRDRMGDASTDPVAASMGSYAVQSQGVAPHAMQYPSLPSGMTNPALPQGAPTHVDPQHQLQSGDSGTIKSNVTNPWFWLMLGLILAAFFTAALI